MAEHVPTWRLIEDLTRKARAAVEGREAFERHMGRKSEKPLTLEVDARDLLRVLTHEPEAAPLKAEK